MSMSLRYACFKVTILSSFKTLFISKMPYYAVARGRISGIFMNWADCETQVKGFPGARYKKFNTAGEAEKFIITEGGSQKTGNVTNGKKTVKTANASFQLQPKTQEKQVTVKSSRKRTKSVDNHIDTDSDEDDLNMVLTKQMDDIEKRLKVFEKDVNKIIKTGTKPTDKKTMIIDLPQPKKRRSGKFEFIEDEDGYVQVYTDGACSSNGRNGARAGIGVYWGDGHQLNVSEPVSGRATNNCGEIQAATSAIKIALQNKVKKLTINTDSQFLINSVTKWMPGWKRKGWKLKSGEPVKNEKDFKELDEIQNKLQIKWIYVEAHKGVHGNEMADQLAKAGASRYVK